MSIQIRMDVKHGANSEAGINRAFLWQVLSKKFYNSAIWFKVSKNFDKPALSITDKRLNVKSGRMDWTM